MSLSPSLALGPQCGRTQVADGWQLRGLLRARRERPSQGRAAEQRDEIAALQAHSITSSAEQRRWYFEAERLGGSEIELRRRLKLRLKRTYCGHHFPSGLNKRFPRFSRP